MRRIVIIGTSGSGKSTFAGKLSRQLDAPCIEMDAVHWGPNWTSRPESVIRERLTHLTAQPHWVFDGNYLKYSDISWARADTIVWLDYPMSTVFPRVVKRTFVRWWRSEVLWSHNRESLFMQFFSGESLFLWVINTWRKNRRDFPRLLHTARKRGVRTFRLHSAKQARDWLEAIPPANRGNG